MTNTISPSDRAAMIQWTKDEIGYIKSALYGPGGRNLWCGEQDALCDRLEKAEDDLRNLLKVTA